MELGALQYSYLTLSNLRLCFVRLSLPPWVAGQFQQAPVFNIAGVVRIHLV